ncbi:[protein-PII] uridylyltransferase family protein [Ornithinimicrobium sp. CNJ-824]|uniref:[protein-PII] uridylyltransferase family protein n=1 Tax=Ornithinimicrobium sp. CNJ-824 TaxID=1904966 RepID=UPI001EDADE69|nr:hypothetical protein [Ornithinimicrobium sp. CNJ-824]
MESERLPRGADPRAHLKLGRGGLSDVEWVVQLLQLQHAHEHDGLRTTSTVEALDAAVGAGLLDQEDQVVLARAWETASQLRDAGVMWRGRPVDSVPSALRDAEGMSRVMGRPPGHGSELAEEWRRTARHARQVVDRLFYGDAPPAHGGRGPATTHRDRGLPGRAAGFSRAADGPPPSAARFPRPTRGPRSGGRDTGRGRS